MARRTARLPSRLRAGFNAIGDLAGWVAVSAGDASLAAPCEVADGCQRAVVWSADGSVVTLGTLGGAVSWAVGINASGDVVGGSTSPQAGNTGYIWFAESQRMVQLPVKARWAAANAVSGTAMAPYGQLWTIGGGGGSRTG